LACDPHERHGAVTLLEAAPTVAGTSSPKVVLVHDYITQRGGAERVVLAMTRTFPEAPLHTSVYQPASTFAEFATTDIVTTGLNRVERIRRDHRYGLPFYATAFSRHDVDADVVVCSSSGWAHGVRSDAPKVVYCYTPARWLWVADDYREGLSRRRTAGLTLLSRPLRAWDRKAAASAARYIVISTVVRDRVRAAYGIDAEILHPPPGLDAQGPRRPLVGVAPGFFLVVSRLLAYKRVGLVIEAMRGRTEQLVVIGAGPDAQMLRAVAPANVVFPRNVDDDQLRWAFANAAGLVAVSKEDFGLTPIEAASFGTPTVAVRAGGYLDSVDEGVTGLFIERPDVASLEQGLSELVATQWNRQRLVRHAGTFSEQAFARRLRAIVREEVA
jgi:glycosyltransferase involved in cell wall biosynthesis